MLAWMVWQHIVNFFVHIFVNIIVLPLNILFIVLGAPKEQLLGGKTVVRDSHDERIGEWTATIYRPKPGRWCSWEGARVLEGYERPTYFSLSGDLAGPYARDLEMLYQILDELVAITTMAELEIEKRGSRASLADFHLQSVSVWDDVDDIFQVDFVPVCEPTLASEVEFLWHEHRVLLRNTNSRVPSHTMTPAVFPD